MGEEAAPVQSMFLQEAISRSTVTIWLGPLKELASK